MARELTDSERLAELESKVSFLQGACGMTAGAVAGLLTAILVFAPEQLCDRHEDRGPQRNELEPELPVRQPMASDWSVELDPNPTERAVPEGDDVAHVIPLFVSSPEPSPKPLSGLHAEVSP